MRSRKLNWPSWDSNPGPPGRRARANFFLSFYLSFDYYSFQGYLDGRFSHTPSFWGRGKEPVFTAQLIREWHCIQPLHDYHNHTYKINVRPNLSQSTTSLSKWLLCERQLQSWSRSNEYLAFKSCTILDIRPSANIPGLPGIVKMWVNLWRVMVQMASRLLRTKRSWVQSLAKGRKIEKNYVGTHVLLKFIYDYISYFHLKSNEWALYINSLQFFNY